jgi:hypothetical protein
MLLEDNPIQQLPDQGEEQEGTVQQQQEKEEVISAQQQQTGGQQQGVVHQREQQGRAKQQRQQQQLYSHPHISTGKQLVVLLSADSAALGLWCEGQLVRHKVLTGYTVR